MSKPRTPEEQELDALVAALPEEQARVMHMKFEEGMGFPEIAAVLWPDLWAVPEQRGACERRAEAIYWRALAAVNDAVAAAVAKKLH